MFNFFITDIDARLTKFFSTASQKVTNPDHKKMDWSHCCFKEDLSEKSLSEKEVGRGAKFRLEKSFLFQFCLLLLFGLIFSSLALGQGWQMHKEEIIRAGKEKKALREQVNPEKSLSSSVPSSNNSANSSLSNDNQTETFSKNGVLGNNSSENNPMRKFRQASGGSSPLADSPIQQSGTQSSGSSQLTSPSLRKVDASQNNGLRRALDFQGVLGEDYRTGLPETAAAAPVEKAAIVEKKLPSYRAFPAMRSTASINDLFFINPQRGWAVGDRGTIWMTADGGNHWVLSNLPFDENLYSVHFMNERTGLAVGGSILSGGKNGRGLILRTEDGGQNWIPVTHPSFPILRKVRFIGPNRVWMAGDSSELYPGGIFISQNAGQSWTADRGTRNAGWNGLVWDPVNRFGIGIGTDGSFQTLRGNTRQTRDLSIGPRRLKDLVYAGGNDPIRMAGEAGLLLQSNDGGENWGPLLGDLPADLVSCFDFNAIYALGANIWASGAPGSLIFFSNDGGLHWNASFTGVRTPIKKIFFSDPQNGWAAGDLGTILVTRDGGRSWNIQREGGRRLALLAFWCDNTTIPWELFVQLSGEQGYLSRLDLLCRDRQKEKTTDEIPRFLRLRDAFVEAGADTLSETGNFQVDSRDLFLSAEKIFAQFDRENDNKGLEKFRERLVRQIRIWRPNVLLIEEGLPNSFQAFLERELPLAIRNAADPLAWPIHLSGCRLEPWTVDRVEKMKRGEQNLLLSEKAPTKSILEGSSKGTVLEGSFFCPSLGRSSGEIARRSRSFLEPAEQDIPAKFRFELLYDRLKSAKIPGQENPEFSDGFNNKGIGPEGEISKNGLTAEQSIPKAERSIPNVVTKTSSRMTVAQKNSLEMTGFFTGLELPSGSEARRSPLEINAAQRRELRERSIQRRRLLGIVESFSQKSSSAGEVMISQINEMIRGLDSELAVEYLLKVGKELYRKGNWTGAEEVYSKIVLDYPLTPMSREACLWLIAYYSGREPFWMTQERNRWTETNVTLNSADRQGQSGKGPTSLSRLALDTSITNPRIKNADDLGKMIRDLLPELYMTPEVRFPLAMIQRERGYVNDAQKFYLNRSLLSPDDLWGIRAKAEYWLGAMNREDFPLEDRFCPLPAIACRSVAAKPFLDGILEPEIWSSAQKVSLSQKRVLPQSERADPRTKSPLVWQEENRKLSNDFGSNVSFLYDNDFLYIGIECRKASGMTYTQDKRPRERDLDLDPFDRIEIQLDTDRDYVTSWKLVFDCRGWAQEAVWENYRWDPRLFIAAHQNKEKWSLEIAIPWEEISQKPPAGSEIWAISLRRIVPRIGIECWNVENSERTENGFGFLTFGMNTIQ